MDAERRKKFHETRNKYHLPIGFLIPNDKHYIKRKANLDDRLDRVYDKIEDAGKRLIEVRAKKQAVELNTVQR